MDDVKKALKDGRVSPIIDTFTMYLGICMKGQSFTSVLEILYPLNQRSMTKLELQYLWLILM